MLQKIVSICRFDAHINPEAGQNLSHSMAGISDSYQDAIVSAYDFSDIQAVADLGGASGSLLSAILQSNPHLHCILFDIPSVIEDIKNNNRICQEISHRCQLEAGSFFDTVPSCVELFLMRRILHDWMMKIVYEY